MEARLRHMTVPKIRVVSNNVVRGFAVIFRSGLKLGTVLFVALTTVSLLNGGTHYLEGKLKGSLKPSRETSGNLVIPRRPHGASSVHAFKPAVSVKRRGENRLLLKESSHLLNEFDRLARILVRLGR